MEFEWDDAKSARNEAERGLPFSAGREIFSGPIVLFDDNRFDYGERRQVAMGLFKGDVVLVVVFTDRHGLRRIISVRKANPRERKFYHENPKV